MSLSSPPPKSRSLLRATPSVPWNVDTMGRLPKEFVDGKPTTIQHIYAAPPSWHVVVVAGTSPAQHTVWVVHHDKFVALDASHMTLSENSLSTASSLLLIDLVVVHPQHQAVFVYLCHPTTGTVCLYQVTIQDLRLLQQPHQQPHQKQQQHAVQHSCMAVCDLTEHEIISSFHVTTSRKNQIPIVLVGTTRGRVWWLQQSWTPPVLQIHTAPTEQASSFWNRLTTPLRGAAAAAAAVKEEDGSATIVATTVSDNDSTLQAISAAGLILQWKIQTIAQRIVLDSFVTSHALQDGMGGRSWRVVKAVAVSTSHTLLWHILVQHKKDRIYWMTLSDLRASEPVWLNRFDAKHVDLLGLIALDNNNHGMAYAAWTMSATKQTILMALVSKNNMVRELDWNLGTIVGLYADPTFGACGVWMAEGVAVRARLAVTSLTTATTTTSSAHNTTTTTMTTPMELLVSHLRSAFWNAYQHPSMGVELPPSLVHAHAEELEHAAVTVATELMVQPNRQGHSYNPMEWHSALINVLQQGGVYTTLSQKCRWQLLGIGQQVAAYRALTKLKPAVSSNHNLAADNVAEWLQQVRRHVGDSNAMALYLHYLCAALKAATEYREERLSSVYDLDSKQLVAVEVNEEVPVWTSHPRLQDLLRAQVMDWTQSSTTGVPVEQVERVVEGALLSRADEYAARSGEPMAAQFYASIQAEAVPLLRQVKGINQDEKAFALSIEHLYFEGLCQIALDHEDRSDRDTYSLLPLFQELEGKVGPASDLPFGSYVLQWHTDCGLLGHALKYGKYCPEALTTIVKQDDRMKPYQWIVASREGDFDLVAKSLVKAANNENVNLGQKKTLYNTARVANRVVEESERILSSPAKHRRLDIERNAERINAQEMLFESQSTNVRLWSGENLVDYALSQIDKSEGTENKSRVCVAALGAAFSISSLDGSQSSAAKIWTKAILQDMPYFQSLIASHDELSDQSIIKKLKGTVFSSVVRYSAKLPVHIKYDAVELQVCDMFTGLGQDFVTELRRVLRIAMQ